MVLLPQCLVDCSEVHHSVCKVVAPHVETVPWFQKFQGVTSGGSHHVPGNNQL